MEAEDHSLFQNYAATRVYQVDRLPDPVEDTWTETDEEWDELVNLLSFHTSVFGFERLNSEVMAYYDAFGYFPTFEILFVDGRLAESVFQFQGPSWSREDFVVAVRIFLDTVIDRQEFSAIAFVHEIPTPYEQGGEDHIFIMVERSYAPLRVMICVITTFELEDNPETHALSVPQYVWSKDLIRDLRMEGVCRDPRFECLLRHGLLEMPTLVAWQPFQGMKLNLDIKMLQCDVSDQRYHIMGSHVMFRQGLEGAPDDNLEADVMSLMQQGQTIRNGSDLPDTLSTRRDDTESLCNGYGSRGSTDIAPHFANQAQQVEELREWLLELLGTDASIILYVFEHNDGEVSTYRISLTATILRRGTDFTHWIRRELAALWNVHARIFPLMPAPFVDLRIAVLLPRAFGRDMPILLEINDGQDSWREIHVVQQAVTINSLLWRSRLPPVVPSTQCYHAMLVGEIAEPNDLVPFSPGQWVTIAVGSLAYLEGDGTTESIVESLLPSLTSLATSHTTSSRTARHTDVSIPEQENHEGDEHTLMQLFSSESLSDPEVHTWMIRWDRRELVQEESRVITLRTNQNFINHVVQTWRDLCEVDSPFIVPISPHVQQAGIHSPAFLVLDYVSPVYRPVFIDLEAMDYEIQGGFLLRDPQVLTTNEVFDQVMQFHRCRTVADCFVWREGHWHEWDESLTVQEGDYLQLLEYTESDDEHSTLCDSEAAHSSHFTDAEISDAEESIYLQLKTWHRAPASGLPPPGNGVYWDSKCMDAMDDLIHCHDGDHVVDFVYDKPRRPIPTPARSRALPRVISISEALAGGNSHRLELSLGLSDSEIEFLLDFDPVEEQLETVFDLNDLDPSLQQMFAEAPKCAPDKWNPLNFESVRIYTDGSFSDGSATWSFVLVACAEGTNSFVGYRSGSIPLTGHEEQLLDTHASAVCAEQHALIWATWWLLRYWRAAKVCTPIVFLWDSQVAGRQAEGLYGMSTALGRLLRGLQLALQQMMVEDVGHLHVPAHKGHLYNEIADVLAKQAHKKCPTCPDNGLLLQLVGKLGHLDNLWLLLTTSPAFPMRQQGCLHWSSTSETAFPKDLLSQQLMPGADHDQQCVSKTCYLQFASYNALSLLDDRGRQTLYADQGRVQLLRDQFEVRGIHFVGIQEARTPSGMHVSHSYIRFCSGKTDGGHYGVELWVSRTSSITDGATFHPGEFLVVFADPRILIVKHQGQLGHFCLVVAHAPHTAADHVERQQWWQCLQGKMTNIVGSLECVVLIDANATAPKEVTQSFGGLSQDQTNKNTFFFDAFVNQNGLFVPSTFEEIQCGPPETWTHSATGKKSRIDYVLLPLSWRWARIQAWVDEDIHAGHAGLDHECTCVDISWNQIARPKRKEKRIDEVAVRDPKNQDIVRAIWASCPEPDWGMNASQHAALITDHLQREAIRYFPKKWGKKYREHISDQSRELHRKVTCLRRTLRNLKKHDDFSLCAVTFRAWNAWRKGKGISAFDSSWNQLLSHATARHARDLKSASLHFRRQLRDDRKQFLLGVAENARNAKPSEVFAALRPILQPAKKQKVLPQPLPVLQDEEGQILQSLDEVNARWVRHFSQLEAGREVQISDYMSNVLQKQQDRCKPGKYTLDDLPSRLDLEKAIRKMRYRKAPGPDRLPNELLKACPGETAGVLFPIILKMIFRLEEPLQWKGGQIISLFKGKGSQSDCQNHRGILLTSVLGKAARSTIRDRLNEPYLAATDDLQLGGKPLQQVLFGTHVSRLFVERGKRRHRSTAILFCDVQSAYYRVLRQIATGATLTDDDLALVLHRMGLGPESMCLIHDCMTRNCAYQELGAGPVQHQVLQETLEGTYFTYTGREFVQTFRGTRPGDSLADIVFNLVFSQVLMEVQQELKAQGLLLHVSLRQKRDPYFSPVTEQVLPMFQVTWADDLAVLVEFEHVNQIESRLALIAHILLQKLQKYGMKVSIGETKTAAVVSPRGPGAVSIRRRLFANTNATFPVLLEDGCVQLPLVPKYRHLGGLIDATGSLLPEIRTRFSKARSAFWRAAKHVFRQHKVPLETRMVIFRSTVMSIMTWGSGAWTELNHREGKTWNTSLWNLYALMMPRTFTAPSRDDIRCYLGCEDPEDLLQIARFRYFGALLRTAPDILWSLVADDSGAICIYQDALKWAYALVDRDSPIREVSDGEAWRSLAAQPAQWARYGRTAPFRATQARLRNAATVKAHKRIHEILESKGLTASSTQSRHGQHFCVICEKAFSAPQGWFLHASQKHNYVSESSEAAQGQTCHCCAKVYLTQERLRHHLRYSASCRAFFEQNREVLPVSENPRSRHPQFPWYRLRKDAFDGPSHPNRDEEKVRALLQEAIQTFLCPEREDDFVDQLIYTLKEACRVAVPFTTLCASLHTWVKEFELTDGRIYQAGCAVQSWLTSLGQTALLSQAGEDNSPFVDEDSRRHIRCRPADPKVRSFLPAELIILHLFSGRRRERDIQMELERQPLPPGVVMTVVSVDVAIDPARCDLSQEQQQKLWYDLIRGGFVAGLYGGPPCESWSIARWESLPAALRRGPRPVRCDPHLWGMAGLSKREGQQVSIGNVLMLFCLKAVFYKHLQADFPG